MGEAKKIGQRIRALRVERGITQQHFANQLGSVSRGAVANWEAGKGIKRENLMCITKTYRLSPDWFLGEPSTWGGMHQDWLIKVMEHSGLSDAELARKVSARIGRPFDRSKIDKAVNGARSISAEELLIISELANSNLPNINGDVFEIEPTAGLPRLGYVQAGTWTEIQFMGEADGHTLVPLPRDARFPKARQYVLGILGDSMNRQYPDPDNTVVTCVEFRESGLAMKTGMVVHIERYRNGGQEVENTLKFLDLRPDGSTWLMPNSTNPAHEPILISGDEDTEIRVRGVVLGSYHKQPI